MRSMKRKAAVAATGLVAAAGISLLGAGAATAATPADGLHRVPAGGLHRVPADGLHRTQSVQQQQSKAAVNEKLCIIRHNLPPTCINNQPPK